MEKLKNAILIDDHTVIATGLESYFKASDGPKIVFIAKSEGDVLDYLENPPKDFNPQNTVAIVDLNLNGMYTFNLISVLKQYGLCSIVYTMYESYSFAMRALECGANAYIFKSADLAELLEAIKEVEKGETYIPKSLEANIARTTTFTALFSPKERIVCEYATQGLSNSEIANLMGISRRTVENYLVHIYDKTGVQDKEGLIKKFNG